MFIRGNSTQQSSPDVTSAHRATPAREDTAPAKAVREAVRQAGGTCWVRQNQAETEGPRSAAAPSIVHHPYTVRPCGNVYGKSHAFAMPEPLKWVPGRSGRVKPVMQLSVVAG